VIIGGKGGVGKSSVSAALGILSADRGLRTVILEFNASHRIPALFGKEPIEDELLKLRHGLYTLNLRPDAALKEYALMKLHSETAYKVVFKNDFMEKFVKMIPGMHELLLIGKAWHMEEERDETGHPEWDMIIVDAPSTGHGIALFALPQTIMNAVKKGPMARDAKGIRALLTDSERTSFHVVVLPEELPFQESTELLEENRNNLHLPEGCVFVNQVWPESGVDAAVEKEIGGKPDLEGVLHCLNYMKTRREVQDVYLKKIGKEWSNESVEIPYVFSNAFGEKEVQEIARHLSFALV